MSLSEKWGKCLRTAALKAPPMGGSVEIAMRPGMLQVKVLQPHLDSGGLNDIARQCEWAAKGGGGSWDMCTKFYDTLGYDAHWAAADQGFLQPVRVEISSHLTTYSGTSVMAICSARSDMEDTKGSDDEGVRTDHDLFLAHARDVAKKIFIGMRVK